MFRELMMKDREERTQTAEEVSAALHHWLTTYSEDSPTSLQLPPVAKPAGPAASSLTETLNPSGREAAMDLPTKKLQRSAEGGLGDFFSSLSDVEPASSKQTGSSTRSGQKSSPRVSNSAKQKASGSVDVPRETAPPETPSAIPTFPDNALTGEDSRQAGRSGKRLRSGESSKKLRKNEVRSPLAKFLPAEIIDQIRKYQIPLIACAAGLFLLIGFLLFGRSPGRPEVAGTPTGTRTGTTDGNASPESPKRPPVSGSVLTVGPEGNFASLTEALEYIKERAFVTTGTPAREVHIAGSQTLKEVISIDNSGLGAFPRGVRVVGLGETPPRLQSSGTESVLSLNAVDGFTMENVIIDCSNPAAGVQLQGFMAGVAFNNVRFENIRQTGLSGLGLSGVSEQPITLNGCTFIGIASAASGIQLLPGRGQDTRDLTLHRCRFLGPLQAGISAQGEVDSLTVSECIFTDAQTAFRFGGEDSLRKKVQFVNNTFYNCSRGVFFETGPSPAADEIRFVKNLFVGGIGNGVEVANLALAQEKLANGAFSAAFNWTDRSDVSGSSSLNVFETNGRTGTSVQFVTTNSSDPAFMKPASQELHSAAADSAEPRYIGAVSP